MNKGYLAFSGLAFSALALTPVGTTLTDFFLSGSEPTQSGTFTASCNCHDGYNSAVEPSFNWKGSMMAHAARDPIWTAAMTISNQDAAFVGDLCIRCHSPTGWLEGRSTPVDGSALTAQDRESVTCEFCHRMVKPFEQGVNPYPNDSNYRSIISGYSTTTSTFARDTTYLASLTARPTLSANGMFAADSDPTRRGPRTDANPPHALRYSPFHRDAALCGTCHDVSNPAFSKQTDGGGNFYYTLNTLNTPPSSNSPYDLFPVERTYSEWTMSSYNSTQGVYAPDMGGNKQYVSTCQDCHMKDVTGKAAALGSVTTRTDLALHDLTGGNTFMPKLVRAAYPSEVNSAAIDSGISRARSMLTKAATMEVFEELPNLRVRVTNQTGHKLPSGYPEGRRVWINVRMYDAGWILVAEYGAYDTASAVLTTSDTKVYEAKLAMSAEVQAASGKTNEADGSSFHFALNNMVVKDNRIPPRGFTNANFNGIQSPPVGTAYTDSQYWDETIYTLAPGTVWYEVNLYYQSVSKEYITFLKDQNTTNTSGTNLYAAWAANGKSAPELMQRAVAQQALPVELTAFSVSVERQTATLRWTTATETNNYGFEIEKNVSSTWNKIGYVEGHGTTYAPQSYTFVDGRLNGVGGQASAAGNVLYRLKQIDRDGKFKYSKVVEAIIADVKTFALDQNYPNPFNPSTSITFSVPVAGKTTLKIYNLLGQEVATLVNGVIEAGTYSEQFNAAALPSGIYLYSLKAGMFSETKHMILIK
jgi:hypothetical protein